MRLLAVLFLLALTRLQAAELCPFDADGVACSLVNEGDAVWRVRTAATDGSFAEVGAVQSLARWMGEPMPGHRTPLTRSEAAGVVTLRAKDGTRAEIRQKPFSLSFFAADGVCVKRLTKIVASGGRVSAEGSLADGEHVMGLGQRLDGLDLRGRRLSVCTTDGYNDSSSSYMAIPFFLTSAGGGVFANGYEFAKADFGTVRPDRWMLAQCRKTLDLYVFAVRTPAESVTRLTALSGRPALPDSWSAGPVICRYAPDLSVLEGATSGDRRGVRFLGYGVKDIVNRYLDEGVKPTAVICEAWGTGLFEGTPEQSARKRAATKEAADWLAAKGMRMMVWMSLGNPLSMNAPGFKKEYLVSVDVETNGVAAARGLMCVPEVRLGNADNPDVSRNSRGRYILDITNPEAWRWYVDVMWGELIRCGVRGAKIDFCEEFPDEAFAYGTTRYRYRWRHPEVFAGAAVHHAYPVFFISRLYRELSARLRDRGGFSVLSRGGGIGSQRAPWMWAGDQVRQFEKLDDQLLAVLSSGMSGVPFMTYDAAGYHYAKLKHVPAAVYDPKTGMTDVSRTEPRAGEVQVYRRDSHVTSVEEEARIFARGIELAAWTGCVQTHGFVRHPYELGERTRRIYRDSLRRFAELAPYRDRLFAEAVKTGVPPVRALAFAFPDDPVAWTVGDEFLLGDRYLVAPVLSDATARSVYLPRGRWKCLRTGEVRDVPAGGRRIDVAVPLDEIAVWENMARAADERPMAYASISSYGGIRAIGNKMIPKELWVSDAEAKAWSERRKAECDALGYKEKGTIHPGHWFKRWVDRYWDSHREYFGMLPNGKRGVEIEGLPAWLKTGSKMCVSNEAVVDQLIEDWTKAGKPECLKCGEMDCLFGYCRCPKCRALDADRPGERFLATKTDRYVNFWNRVAAKARALRPDVKVAVHLYARYYEPPRREKVLYPENLVCSFVAKFQDPDPAETIRRWKAAGLKYFFFRPNYLCNRSALPIGREKFIWRQHREMLAVGSLGDCFDSTPGVPSTDFDHYTAVRLCADPDVAFDEIERDWCARFGAAAETVRAYYARIRERCDRGFVRLLAELKAADIEFLDDSHFSRHYHKLHTVADLEDDLALLERFDVAKLDGEARRRFEDLKVNARHYVLVRQALLTESEKDKQALLAYRIAHKASLGMPWQSYWNKGEFWLWNKDPAKLRYEDTGIVRVVEDIENALR